MSGIFHPDPAADGLSERDYCATLPKRRHSALSKGALLLLPRTGLVVCLATLRSGGYWEAVVVIGNDTYPPDGYCLHIAADEVETAIDVTAVLFDGMHRHERSDFDWQAREFAEEQERAEKSPFAKACRRAIDAAGPFPSDEEAERIDELGRAIGIEPDFPAQVTP